MHTPEGPACDVIPEAQAWTSGSQVGGGTAPASPAAASLTAATPASPEPGAHTMAWAEADASSVPTSCPPCFVHDDVFDTVAGAVPPFGKFTMVHVPGVRAFGVSVPEQPRLAELTPDTHVTAGLGAPHVQAVHAAGAPDGSATPACWTAA
jgi:hypothetical protein